MYNIFTWIDAMCTFLWHVTCQLWFTSDLHCCATKPPLPPCTYYHSVSSARQTQIQSSTVRSADTSTSFYFPLAITGACKALKPPLNVPFLPSLLLSHWFSCLTGQDFQPTSLMNCIDSYSVLSQHWDPMYLSSILSSCCDGTRNGGIFFSSEAVYLLGPNNSSW